MKKFFAYRCLLPLALFFLPALNACNSDAPPATASPAATPDAVPDTAPIPLPMPPSSCQLVTQGFGPDGRDPVRLEKVISGLEVPWGIAFLPNGNWLVTERPGRIRLVRRGVLQSTPVATVVVGEPGEGGLLGIALHPRFFENRFFYVYYTTAKTSGEVNRVERFKLSGDDAHATADKVIIDDIPAGPFHDGGRIHFGPDRMLYVGTGDGRSSDLAQDNNSLAGKLLRLTDDGKIPSDNPVPGKAFFLKGIRNTEGFGWYDIHTIFMTDNGPTGEFGRMGNDELTIARVGNNLGWPTVSGCDATDSLTTPSLAWLEATPPGGGAIYRGDRIPGWRGNFLIGTLGSKHLERIIVNPDGTLRNEVYFQGDPPSGYGRLREVAMGNDGELYVTTSNCDGRGVCPSEGDSILRLRR